MTGYIPFLPRFHEAIRLGVKTMTCRTRKYGEPGDILNTNLRGVSIQILEVRHVRLGDVADNNFIDEGCESRGEFVNVWEAIHPQSGFNPEKSVWLHIFRVADTNLQISQATDTSAHGVREV